MRHFNGLSTVTGLAALAFLATACGGQTTSPALPAGGTADEHRSSASLLSDVAGLVAELPRPAGAFVNSIGVNVHLSASNTPYTNDFSTMVSQLSALGIHHVRDGMHPGATWLCSEAQQLAAAGIRLDYITAVGYAPSDITGWAACVGPAAESFEGPNEYDLNHPQSDANWPATLASFQQMLYATVKENLPTATLPVLGPSLTSQAAYASVGNLASYEDYGNMHDYFAGRNPGTPGFGNGGYGSIPYNINVASQASVGKSIDATETGYPVGSSAINPYVTEWIAGKYMPRLFLEQWNNGVPRTWAYEFYDDGNAPDNTYGWVHSNNLQPKWQYWAMKNFITVIADRALSLPNASALAWSMTGNTSNVAHTLLQKADGSTYLALWIETPANDPNAGTIYSIAPQAITVNFAITPRTITVYSYDSDMNFNGSSKTPSTTLPLDVTDMVTLVRLT